MPRLVVSKVHPIQQVGIEGLEGVFITTANS